MQHSGRVFTIIYYPCKVIACRVRVTRGNESGNKEKRKTAPTEDISYVYMYI